jgi:predicted RNA-binding Zn-ribbon protein involved in translation (DUF1610 family)
MSASKILLDFLRTLEDSSKMALGECMQMPGLEEDDSALEMDFVVRVYHHMIRNGLLSKNFMFQWGYKSLGPKHIDMIYQEGSQEIAVEIEPIRHLWGSEPHLRRDRNKKELEDVGEKLRGIAEEEVLARTIVVPYFGKSKSLPFDKIETELQTIAGSNVILKLVHGEREMEYDLVRGGTRGTENQEKPKGVGQDESDGMVDRCKKCGSENVSWADKEVPERARKTKARYRCLDCGFTGNI